MYELALAANILDIKSLHELICAKIASGLKGKDAAGMRDFFKVANDLSEEEIA